MPPVSVLMRQETHKSGTSLAFDVNIGSFRKMCCLCCLILNVQLLCDLSLDALLECLNTDLLGGLIP